MLVGVVGQCSNDATGVSHPVLARLLVDYELTCGEDKHAQIISVLVEFFVLGRQPKFTFDRPARSTCSRNTCWAAG